MRKSRAVKRQLINDLWDDFTNENTIKLQNVGKLEWKLKQAKSKTQKAAIQKKIDDEPKSILSLDQLFNITAKDKKHYMDLYFEMRLLDYSIQTITRYCSSASADLGTVDELKERCVMFDKKVEKLLGQLGIPVNKSEEEHIRQLNMVTV